MGNKKEITLDLYNLNQYFKELYGLIVSNVVETKGPKGMDNVLRFDVASLFPSLQTMTIKCSWDYGYRFRLQALLELMQSISSLDTVIIIGHNWVKDVLTDEISAEFGAVGWCFRHDETYDDGYGRWVVHKSKVERVVLKTL